jgi:hypothetical protein
LCSVWQLLSVAVKAHILTSASPISYSKKGTRRIRLQNSLGQKPSSIYQNSFWPSARSERRSNELFLGVLA